MPKILFKKQISTAEELKNKILVCLQMIHHLDSDDVGSRILIDKLIGYTQRPEYQKLSTRLKNRVQKLITEVEASEVHQGSIQIPSSEDMKKMKYMPAGADEDQLQRLTHMAETVQQHAPLPVITTDNAALPPHWNQLFATINQGQSDEIVPLLKQFPADDIIFRALLAVHSQDYLLQVISCCIAAKRRGFKQLNADIVVTPETFEILIKDIATTFLNPSPVCFSFGLPSHHAYSTEGRGFCLFNKTAILMKHWESTHAQPLKYVIVGTDVNRDDGLANILRQIASYMDICHVDVFDSRVYPQQNFSTISEEFGYPGSKAEQHIQYWTKEQLQYYAVDLSVTTRKKIGVHPALLFALSKIKDSVEEAKTSGQKIVLLLPTGWDSHQDETAYCGKFINGRMMAEAAAHQTRFNDGDLTYFYERIFRLYNQNKDHIEGIYWGLEGGYDRAMYERQIELMLHVINTELEPQKTSTSLPGMN